MTDPNTPPAPKKSGCLRTFLILAGIVTFVLLLVGLSVWNAISWAKNSPQTTPATVAPLKLSPGEEEDVEHNLNAINEARFKGKLIEAYVSPTVFNGMIEQILEGERKKPNAKKDIPLFIRGAFTDGNRMQLTLSVPMPAAKAPNAPPGATEMYINAEVEFYLEIVDGEIKVARLHKAVAAGREAPTLAYMFINGELDKLIARAHANKDDPNNPFSAFKLLKRDGDRLHVIIDGEKIKQQEEKKSEKKKEEQKKADEKPTTF